MSKTSPLVDPAIVPDPYEVYAELAKTDPIHWCDGLNAWAVMRHADCRKVLNDTRFKAERMETILKVKFPDHQLPRDSIYHRFTSNVMMYTDPPLHDSLRRSTMAGFTRAAHDYYGEVIKNVAFDLIAELPKGGGSIDAVGDLAAKLPVNAAVRAFGLPEEDLPLVLPLVNAIMTYWSGPQGQPEPLDRLIGCLEELHTYATELVEGKQGKVLPNTVIARLAAAQPTNTDCTPTQTIHQLVLLLIALFAPTTPGSASSGILAFANNPEQISRFLGEKACVDNTADEVVRYNASNQFTWRVAGATVEIGGIRIEKGQVVTPFLGAANRDPAVFGQPNFFDLRRSNSGQNLSFGAGAHACLGKQIASLEIKWFFVALLQHFPRIRLAGAPVWNENLEFRSLKSLPIELGC